jgi:hypothetical protein
MAVTEAPSLGVFADSFGGQKSSPVGGVLPHAV